MKIKWYFIFLYILCLNCCIKEKPNNIYTVDNKHIWLYVETDIDGKLNAVNIYDTHGRRILVNYSDVNILNYMITDDLCNYYIETDFSDQYFSNGRPVIFSDKPFQPVYVDDMKKEENTLSRIEQKGQMYLKYIINFSQEPYFFILE